jgi:hypothetical protein
MAAVLMPKPSLVVKLKLKVRVCGGELLAVDEVDEENSDDDLLRLRSMVVMMLCVRHGRLVL